MVLFRGGFTEIKIRSMNVVLSGSHVGKSLNLSTCRELNIQRQSGEEWKFSYIPARL